jgi:hypothetical protein
VRNFGRLITKNGVHFDPKNMVMLQTMREPQNGAPRKICQLDANNDTQHSKRMAPLQAALAKVFEDTSHSVADTPLGTRGASGFQRFTSSYHGVNDFGFSRPRQENLCLD